jgi:hypothetical protein
VQEWRGKYSEAEMVRTSPMVDGPVIFVLGRTPMELFLPAPLAALFLWKFGFPGLLLPVLVFFLLPRMRERLGRNRLLHFLWGMGAVRCMRLAQQVVSLSGGRTGEEVPSPFVRGRVKRLGP